MSAPVDSAPGVSETPSSSLSATSAVPSPVAVVWCRQVDNEAESPGYTTVPEDFPGQRETLDIIRIVGHLTVNVADTHDYWDPDPSQPLSYYPNLFLYPAYGGRYTCIGRMFLSTEDRPRLGMKTLVLDTAQLLASGEYGSTILRWHASMGGPRRDGGRPPPVPDPSLYPVVGEGFLFHRGSTDPVLLVASEEWEPSMQVILELVRTLPASLVALGAILAFPYFLPQAKTNLHEFTEQVPLSLALMRVARGEAVGDRHTKRLDAWESSNLTVRDLADGIPTPTGRAKDTPPLVLQYARDQNEAKLTPIVQRVDLVEMSRLRQHLTDPERQGGKDRRKEMWRIGTAMESAALLLQRSRGRHIPVSADASKRAQEYVQARLPTPEVESPASEPALAAPLPPAAASASAAVATSHPPWLQRAPPPGVPPPPSTPEVVPMSVSDDPSLLRPSPTSPRASPAAAGVAVVAPVDTAALKQEIQRDLVRFFDERLEVLSQAASREAARSMEARIAEETDRHLEARLAPLQQQIVEELKSSMQALEARSVERLDALRASATDSDERFTRELRTSLENHLNELGQAQEQNSRALRDDVHSRLEGQRAAIDRQMEQQANELAQRWHEELVQSVGEEVGRRTAELVDPRIQASVNQARAALLAALMSEIDQRVDANLAPKVEHSVGESQETLRAEARQVEERLSTQVAQTITELQKVVLAREEETRATLAAQVEVHLSEAGDRAKTVQLELERRVDQSVARQILDVESRRAREIKDLEGRLSLLLDGRERELSEKTRRQLAEYEARVQGSLDQKQRAFEAKVGPQSEAKLAELKEGQLHALAELQVRMQSYVEQRQKEGQDREREKYIELLARLKGEVDAALPKILDSPRFEEVIRLQVARGLEGVKTELIRAIDQRSNQAEDRLRAGALEGSQRVERVEAALGDRNKELVRLEEGLRADMEELDRRTEILSDRLVPVVRKTWLRIAELEKANPNSPDADLRFNQLRREFHRELRRLEGEIAERTGEIRDRMETSIANQGKVWLTLIRQLSQLTEARRAREAEGREPVTARVNPMAPSAPVDPDSDGLEDIPDLLSSRARRSSGGTRRADPPPDTEDTLDLDEDEERERRRRSRRTSSR